MLVGVIADVHDAVAGLEDPVARFENHGVDAVVPPVVGQFTGWRGTP